MKHEILTWKFVRKPCMFLCISLLPSSSRSILSRRWRIQLFDSEIVGGTSASVSMARANLVNRSWEDVLSQKESSSSRRILAFSGSLCKFSRIAVTSLMTISRSCSLIYFVLVMWFRYAWQFRVKSTYSKSEKFEEIVSKIPLLHHFSNTSVIF